VHKGVPGASELAHFSTFFQEPEVFQTLQELIFPHIAANLPPGEPWRIWVTGCSSGEELYSVAIALLEYLTETETKMGIQVFGTDPNEFNIQTARKGVYTDSSTKSLSRDRLRRFFEKVEGGYRVAKPLRDICVFGRHDLSEDVPFSRMDLVSCRNTLANFAPALQKKVLDSLSYALKPTGFLILDQSDTVGASGLLSPLTHGKVKVYSKAKAEVDLRASERNLRRLSARLLSAAEAEGKKIARELHDSVGPSLASINLRVSEVANSLSSQPDLAIKLEDIGREISGVAKTLHDLSRQLHPAVLSQLGLQAALESECAAFSKLHGIEVEFSAQNVPESLPERVALCLYRVAQESLRNIRQHALTKKATVKLEKIEGEIVMVIEDFGRGFDPHRVREGGLGLVSMEERVRLVDGSVWVNPKPGDGTKVEVHVPLRL